MKITTVAVGNKYEAYVEPFFSNGVNIITSDDNNKGKTIVIQSILYALGNRPIFPSTFNYRDFHYYVKFEHEGYEWILVRSGDSYILKAQDGIRFFDGMSELKRYWTAHIFCLPVIPFLGGQKIVDMELFLQMFFVGQDSRKTSTIFNDGYYHKDDFKNMVLSYAENFSSELPPDEEHRIKEEIRRLKTQRQEKVNLCEFYSESAPATEYLSRIKDKDAFNKRVSEMEAITEQITEVRKKRNNLASKKALWAGTLKELHSLNRNIEVGELRCMDCNSTNIAYKGTGKAKYSFDVSTPEMRNQIIESINEKINALAEEIAHCDFDVEQFQTDLKRLIDNDDVTVENIVAYKSGFRNAEEVEAAIQDLDEKIAALTSSLENNTAISAEAKEIRELFYRELIDEMNTIRQYIDPESDADYSDLFTKRDKVISGSEETIFYTAKLISLARKIRHGCPIIIDSFRAEDLSTDKEHKVLELLKDLESQCIITTTLKAEERGKYDQAENITVLDYSSHTSNKVLQPSYVDAFVTLLGELGIQLQ